MKCKLMNLFAAGGAGAILLSLLAAGPAHAGSSTSSMQVSAVVNGACSITANPMSFGALTVSGGETTQQDTSATVSYSCNTTPTGFTVSTGLNDGEGSGTGLTTYPYAMANGASYIAYGLDVYDNSSTFLVSDAAIPGTPGSGLNSVDGTNSPVWTTTGGPYTISAEIPAGQTTIAGTYTDNVTFTMSF